MKGLTSAALSCFVILARPLGSDFGPVFLYSPKYDVLWIRSCFNQQFMLIYSQPLNLQ